MECGESLYWGVDDSLFFLIGVLWLGMKHGDHEGTLTKSLCCSLSNGGDKCFSSSQRKRRECLQ